MTTSTNVDVRVLRGLADLPPVAGGSSSRHPAFTAFWRDAGLLQRIEYCMKSGDDRLVQETVAEVRDFRRRFLSRPADADQRFGDGEWWATLLSAADRFDAWVQP